MKLWLFIKENKLWSLVISMTIAVVSATPSAIRRYNRHIIAVHQEQIRDSIRAANMDTAIYYFSVIKHDISGIVKDMLEIKTSQSKLKDYMIEKAATKQDLLDVVKVFEIEKKNE